MEFNVGAFDIVWLFGTVPTARATGRQVNEAAGRYTYLILRDCWIKNTRHKNVWILLKRHTHNRRLNKGEAVTSGLYYTSSPVKVVGYY
jgi:hypothetical protein